MSNHNKGRFGGRGYYIALILCAAAVGIMSYVFYQNPEDVPAGPDTPVLATSPTTPNKVVKSGENEPVLPTETGETTTPTEPRPKKMSVCAPVEGTVAAEYAMEVLSYNQTTRDWRTHNGMDIAAEPGTQVVAAAEGEVYTVYEDDRMGMTVVIRHEDGYVTKYASLAEDVLVSPGDPVEMGQAIGCVGTTALMETAIGDHVHFSVTRNDETVDPEEFLNQ